MLVLASVIFSAIVSAISGAVGDVVFSRWKGIPYIRSRVIPSNPQTAAQTSQREALADTLTMWQSIKSWAKTVWDLYATGYAVSGYNRYMDDNILHTKAGTAGSLAPFNADYIKVSGMALAAGGAGIIVGTWTNVSGVSPTDFVQAFYRKTETGDETYEWVSGGGAYAVEETHSISGLDTGEEYEAVLVPCTAAQALCQESFNKVLVAG